MSGTNVRAFASAFRTHWFAAMSGGFSVPFTALSVIVDNKWTQFIFAFLAFSAVWVAAYRIWKPERERVLDLEERARPRLKCSFNANDLGCKRPNVSLGTQDGAVRCDWYRLKVETASNVPVSGCQGRLVEILRAGNPVFSGEKITLPFAYGSEPDATAKTIHPGVAEHLDFLAVTYDNRILLTAHGQLSGSINWNDIFSLPGDYLLRIVIVSPNADSCPVDVWLSWTLDHATTRVTHQTTT